MKPEDVIGILNRKVQNATVTEDQIDAAVEKYHKTHPLETDKTLTVPGAFADAKAMAPGSVTPSAGFMSSLISCDRRFMDHSPS